MKKLWVLCLLLGILLLTGCQTAEEQRKTEVAEAFEKLGMEHNEVVRKVLAKRWTAQDTKENCEFTLDGTGDFLGEACSYLCGFDEKNDILLQLTMTESGEQKQFLVSADETGFGLYLQSMKDETVMYLLPEQMEILSMDRKEVQSLLGAWKDSAGYTYRFARNGELTIKDAKGDKNGSFFVLLQEGEPVVVLVLGESKLTFSYEISEDGTSMQLWTPGTETIHTWVKES